jgi:hypothetical protein
MKGLGMQGNVYRDRSGSQRLATQQLKFLCPSSSYDRLKNEKLIQRRPLQDLLNDALEMALERWEQDHDLSPDERKAAEENHEINRDLEESDALRRGLIRYKSETFLLASGEYQWVQLWISFMRDLPEGTVNSTKQIMKDLFDFFRSSRRRKPESSRTKGAQENVQTRKE